MEQQGSGSVITAVIRLLRMQYSLRFLFVLLIVAAVSTFVVMDRQKLHNENESLRKINKELHQFNRMLKLNGLEERLAKQDLEFEALKRRSEAMKRDSKQFNESIGLPKESGRMRSLDWYRRPQD